MSSPRLMDQVRGAYSLRTEQSYLHWIKRFILFHGKRHPRDMGAQEIAAFLTHLAVSKDVSASTQNQALAAILFLYKKVLNIELEWIEDVVRAKRPGRSRRDGVGPYAPALVGLATSMRLALRAR